MGVDPDIDDIDLGTFDSLDAAKRSVEEDEEETLSGRTPATAEPTPNCKTARRS
jgi:hypothetical protein